MSLADVLKMAPPRVFAAVDGALLEEASDAIDAAGLLRRPLYRGVLEDAGIQLVELADADEIDRLLSLFDDVPGAVFWSWPGDGEGLFRHLRGIGKVEAPRPGSDPADPQYEQVLFRHADPRSLMPILRVMTDAQRDAFLGEARGLIFEHVDHFGVARVVRVPRDGRLLTGDVASAA